MLLCLNKSNWKRFLNSSALLPLHELYVTDSLVIKLYLTDSLVIKLYVTDSLVIKLYSCCQKLRMTQILIFTKSTASICMMAICTYSRMLWRVIRWIAINCICKCKWTESPKYISIRFQPCHKRTSWHHVSDSLVDTGVSVDEDKAGYHSVMLIEFE